MSITTQEAERLARLFDPFPIPADALRSLAAERDALRAEVERLQDDVACLRLGRNDARLLAVGALNVAERRIARQRRALAKLYRKRYDRKAENARLREALRLAIEAVEFWAAYATSYFQDKHDLAGDLQKLRAVLGEKE
jgi:hypothetical protein